MTRKTSKRTSKKSALPTAGGIPEGMKQMGGGYANTWKPENEGDTIHGPVTAAVKTVEFDQRRKVKGKWVNEKVERRVCEVTNTEDDQRYAVWESAALAALFDELAEAGDDAIGTVVFLRFDGLGKKKAGQNAPKLFTVAMAA